MLVTCIDNINLVDGKPLFFHPILNITIGKKYKILEMDTIGFKIYNDKGRCSWYTKSKFEPVEISRNKILEELGI